MDPVHLRQDTRIGTTAAVTVATGTTTNTIATTSTINNSNYNEDDTFAKKFQNMSGVWKWDFRWSEQQSTQNEEKREMGKKAREEVSGRTNSEFVKKNN